uniref:FHF complex subunit HOOK-interacting protein C-terminal domain-containing protein n=1 Tax=Gasterosteus aculeatus aculeatus TaxID=481459 RepID=A0AAQ4QLV5_GASAC|nr:protein FAM160A1-like isoform X3 [Gasterosteus aculeatus aculeatus]
MMKASAVVGGNRRRSLSLRGVDPETCMIVFKNHWSQVVKILEKHEPARGVTGALSFLSGPAALRPGPVPADEASAVQNYVEHMLFLLMEEEVGQGGAMGPILEFVVVEGVMERLFLWSLRRQFTEDMKLEQLRMYQMLLSQARQPLLHHKPVLRPLMMLLASCAGPGTDSGGVVEAELVLLLNQLCVALVKDPSVLELFFHTSEDQGAANFLLFSLLIPYTHRRGSVGQQARDALLLIMSLSASDPRVALHITQNTYFCPVLATGLSGLYSSLPARLQVYSEDWHCLAPADWQQVPALVHFLHSLDFCSAVTKVAHPSIRSQLLGYIYNGFLVPVLAPALHKLTVEEVMTTTAYLDLFLRSISEPALLHSFLSFILLHTHDNVHILDTLVSRVNTPFQLGTVSLALFRTLIGLFCEDVMLQLVFRYLVPCSHLSGKQRSALRRRDSCSSSAASFLLLSPPWCAGTLLGLGPPTEHVHWPRGAGLSLADSVGYRRGADFPMDVNYLHYLWDARQAISTALRASRQWSCAYDGFDPPPQDCRSGSVLPEDDLEDELARRVNGDAIYSLLVAPPPSALSPTPSSSDTVSAGNQVSRAGSALELEWDDIFADEYPPLLSADAAGGGVAAEVDGCVSTPRHIQEMRRTATKLVRGSYVEESEFQDDVLVYDLVAQRETKAAILERIMAANRRSHGSFSNGQRAPTAAGKTVIETVNNIMSTRRRSEDGGREERRRSEDGGKEAGRKKEEGEEEMKRTDAPGGRPSLTNGFDAKNLTIDEDYEDNEDDEDGETFHTRHNGDPLVTPARAASPPGNDAADSDSDNFLSRYQELMRSLGAEPDCDDVTNDIGAFRRRVRALRQKLEEEESFFCSSWDDGGEEEEEEAMEEVEEEGEERRRRRREGSRRHGVPFTGPFISVLLSRLENLLENSIAVNLLVTGLLAQLASYPQPLLRSFLLSTDTHDQPNVRTLHQVLVSERDQIERYVAARPDFPALVTQAWRFLLAKDQESKFRECLESCGDRNSGPDAQAPPPLAAALLPCPPIPPRAKSRVFAVVLFAEFLKELAAVAQEHSVALQCTAEE